MTAQTVSKKKNQSLKCSQDVRNIPLERFRLPNDGRKWKQAARSRSAFLCRLATYANADGTFVRDGRNYSPSLKTLLKHVAKASYFRLTDDLQALRLLSWSRDRHHDRRIYTIHLPEQVSDSQEKSSESGPTVDSEDQNQVQGSPEQVSDSQRTGLTTVNHPSLPSLPSKERTENLGFVSQSEAKTKTDGQGKASYPKREEHPQVKVIVKAIDKSYPSANIDTFDRKALSEALHSASPIPDETVVRISKAYISNLQDHEHQKAGRLLAGKFIEMVENAIEREDEAERNQELFDTIIAESRRKREIEEAEMLQQRAEEEAQAAQIGPNGEGLFG